MRTWSLFADGSTLTPLRSAESNSFRHRGQEIDGSDYMATFERIDYLGAKSIRFPKRCATLAIVLSVIDVLPGSSKRSIPVRLVFSRFAISALDLHYRDPQIASPCGILLATAHLRSIGYYYTLAV
jgi:hypothetical protein